MAKQLNVNLAFTADTGKAKAQIQDLQNQLSHLSTSVGAGQTLGLTKELNEAAIKAAELKGILASSTTPTGTLDLGKFNESLKKSGTTIKDYAKSLNALGPEGQRAFSQLAQAVTTAEMPMRRANGLLSEMWTTMKNTARWQLTSSMIHGFMGGLQQAVGYAKDLNRTLTDIRIVAPEKSMEDMAHFADLANKRAKELSSTTLDYAKGALIYYQQGLDDIEVQQRTDVTTKMANVTGDSADEVSSYMTAIWNNFNRAGDESAEHFADILTKLGAETAASTTEITDAIEKYSAVADTIGLSYEAATAAATTLIDRTRETPEVAGTALKTIFARIEGLKQEGSTEEGGTYTSLNKYSEALHNIGVEIKDTNGEMRDADDIIDDIGGKWSGLARDQQIALAETVAGVRQWNQFAALMDNYDFYEKYKEMAESGSGGALEEQQKIYEESWQAASNRVKSSIQTIYMQLLDDKFFIELTNKIADLVEGFSKLIDGVGGLKTILPAIGTLMFAAFGDKMAKGISNMAYNMQLFGKTGKEQMQQLRKESNQALLNQSFGEGYAGQAAKSTYQAQFDLQEKILNKKEQLNEFEQKQLQFILDQNNALGQQVRLNGQNLQEKEKELDNDVRKTKRSLTDLDEQNKVRVNKDFNDLKQQNYAKGFVGNMALNLDESISKVQALSRETEYYDELTRELTQEEKERQNLLKQQSQELEEQIADYKKIIAEDENLSNNQKRRLLEALNKEDSEGNVVIGNIIHDIDEAGADFDRAQENAFNNLVKHSGLSPEQLEGYKKRFEELGEDAEAFKRSLTESERSALRLGEEADKIGSNLQSGSEVLMNFAQTAMSCVMAFEAIKNAVEIFNDPDATFGEQLIAALTAMTMVIPAVISGMQLLKIENIQAVAASLATTAALETEAKAATTLSGAFKALGKSMIAFITNPYALAFLAIAGAVAAVGFALKKNYDATHQARQGYEELQTSVVETNKNFDELSSRVDNLNSSLNSLKSQKEHISDLTSGTAEWTEAVGKLNEETQNAVDEFNALNDSLPDDKKLDRLHYGTDYYYDDQGVLQLSDKAQKDLTQIKNAVLEIAKISRVRNEKTLAEAKYAAGAEALTKGNFGSGQKLTHSSDYIKAQEELREQALKDGNVASLRADQFKMSSDEQQRRLNALDETIAKAEKTGGVLLAGRMNIRKEAFEASQEIVKNAETKQFDTSNTGVLADQTLEIIKTAVMRGEIDSNTLNNKHGELEAILTRYGESVDRAVQQADLIANNAEDLKESLIDNTLATKEATQKYLDVLQQNVLGDKTNPFNEDIKKIEKDYRGGAAGYIAENWLLAENSIKDAEGEDYKQARINYAKTQGFTTKDGGKTFQNESGEEKNFDDEDSEKLIQAYYKEQEALEKLNTHKKQYLDFLEKEVEDSKKDNRELNKLAKAYKNIYKSLFDAKDYKTIAKNLRNMKDSVSEVLDISDPSNYDTIFNDEFVEKNAATIQEALKGDKQALDDLYDAYQAEDFVLNITNNSNFDLGQTEDEFRNALGDFQAWVDENAEIGVPIKVDTGEALDKVNGFLGQMVQDTRNASEVVKELNRQGFSVDEDDIEFVKVDIPAEATVDMATVTNLVSKLEPGAELQTYSLTASDSEVGWELTDTQPTYKPTYSPGSPKYYEEMAHNPQTRSIYIPRVKKGSGASFTKTNYTLPKSSGGNKSARPSGSGGGNRGGGGGGRGSQRRQERVRKARRQDEKSVIIKRYKEITDKLDRNSKASERLAKIQDKLYGKAHLNQMDKVNKKHLEEINLLRQKQKEARQYYLNDQRDAQKALKDVMKISKEVQKGVKKINKYDRLTSEQKAALARIDELKFNNFGEITNYTSIMKALQDQLNAYERVYNSKKNFGNEESQSKYKEKIIDPLKAKIDALQEAIDQYDETRELVEELKDQIDDAYNEWQSANYERLQYALDINVSINDNQLKRLDYYFNKINNNVYKAAEAFDMYFTGVGSYSSTMKDKVSVVADNLQETLEQISQTREDLLAETAKAKAALEDAKKNYSTSKKVTGKKNKKGRYISYDINSFGNWKNAKKQYDRAKKLLKIGRIKKDKFDKIKSRFEQQNKYKKLYDEALKRYRDALRAGGVSVQEAQANLNKIILTEEEKKKIKEIRKNYSNKQQTNKYKKAKKAYKKAIKNWKKVGKKKTSGQYYEAAKKAWKALEKAKANYNKKYNENKYLKAKKAWEKSGKKKSGKAYEKYQEQLKARKAYKDALKQYSGKYSEANYNSAKLKYEKAKAKLESMKKGTKKYKKQKEKVKALKEAFNQQKLLKEQYELWSIALENAKSNEELISNQNAALEAQKQELAGVNEQLSEYTQLTAVGGKIGAITKAIFLQVEAYTELEKEYQNCEISQAQYVEGMQQSYDTTLDLLSQLQDLKNEMKDYYGDVISNASEELSKFNTQLDHQASVISHLQTLADLANKQKDFDLYENFSLANMAINQAQAAEDRAQYATFSRELELAKDKRDQVKEQIESLNKNSKDFTSEYSNTVKQEIADAEKRLEQIKKSGSKEEIANAQEILNSLKEGQKAVEQLNSDKLGEVLKTQLDYYEKMVESADEAASNAYDSMFGNLEEAMENNASLLETSLQRAADAMEKALTQIAGGFEEISRQMGLTSTNQDEYLTKTNQNYELNKLQRTLQKDIDKTNNREAKTRFANFSKELKQLQEKDKLSNLELEIAQKRYELLKAQIDLEDSRNAKQTIRLSRDSEGNYGYVYVANEDQVEDAKQAVEDANNDLYNLQLQATNNYGQKYIQTAQEMQQALMEAQEITDKAEREARINAIRDQYGTLMDTYKNLYEIGYGATDYLEDALKADSWIYDNYNGIVNNVSNNLSAFNNYIEDANRAWSEWQANTDKIYQLYDIQELFDKILPDTQEKVNKNLDDFQTALSAINDVLAKVHEKLFNFVEAVLPVLEKWIQSTEGTADKMLDNIIYQSTHDTSKDRYENFNKMMQILADKEGLAKGAGYNYYEGALYSTGGQLGSNAKMAQTWDMSFNEAKAKEFLDKGGQYTDGYYGFTSDGKLMFTLNPTEEQLKEFKSLVTKAIKLDSGGYTGDWTDENSGKLAFLHEKELVLNANDTQNILAVVDSVREMAAAGFLSSLHSASINSSALGTSSIAQEIHIDAQFPGVTDRYEIEQAFNNLANRAVQYANNTRK